MSNPNEPEAASKSWLIALTAVTVLAICAFGFARLSDHHAKPANTVDGQSTSDGTPSANGPDDKSPSGSGSFVPIVRPRCVGPGDLTNVAGRDQQTLPADCGNKPVPQNSNKALGLACGGKYPVIMFKTTTKSSRTTICGVDSSGEVNYMVTKPNGGKAIGMSAEYAPGLNAFVAHKNKVTYIVEAYNGSLAIKKAGSTHREVSKNWISLDNESDYD